MIHWLKTAQPHFDEVWSGSKTFEIRKDDRGYAIDDLLILGEGINDGRAERAIVARVTSVLPAGEAYGGITTGHVALGIVLLGKFDAEELKLFEHTRTEVTSEEWTAWRKAKQLQNHDGTYDHIR